MRAFCLKTGGNCGGGGGGLSVVTFVFNKEGLLKGAIFWISSQNPTRASWPIRG